MFRPAAHVRKSDRSPQSGAEASPKAATAGWPALRHATYFGPCMLADYGLVCSVSNGGNRQLFQRGCMGDTHVLLLKSEVNRAFVASRVPSIFGPGFWLWVWNCQWYNQAAGAYPSECFCPWSANEFWRHSTTAIYAF